MAQSPSSLADTVDASLAGPTMAADPDEQAKTLRRSRTGSDARPRNERYAVERRLGAGGMGAVWLARDMQLDRPVAIKTLQSWSDESLERLRREAKVIGQLNHPNVVQVFDVGTDPDDPYIVMEELPGPTLEEVMRRLDPSQWRRAVDLFARAGAGLVAAHERGLVHRDFKPANVMMDREGNPKVLDFGLARLDPETETNEVVVDSSGDVALTRAGAILGTPLYMAPEQYDAGTPSVAMDVFAFGASLWEALYGSPPFKGSSLEALAVAKLHGPDPERPDDRVPMAVHRVVLRALRPSPEDRWPDMAAMLDALARAVRPRGRGAWLAAGTVVAGVGALAIALVGGSSPSVPDHCRQAAQRLSEDWRQRAPELERALNEQGYEAPLREGTMRRLSAYVDRWTERYERSCEASEGIPERVQQCLLLQRETSFPSSGEARHAVLLAGNLPPVEDCDDEVLSGIDPMPRDPTAAARVREIETLVAQSMRELGLGQRPDFEALEAALEDSRAIGYRPTTARVLKVLMAKPDVPGHPELELAEEAFELARASGDAELAAEIAILAIQFSHRSGQSMDEVERWARHARALLERDDHTLDVERGLASSLSLVYVERGQPQRALDVIAPVLARPADADALRMEDLIIHQRRAAALLGLGRYDEAADAYRQSLGLRRRLRVEPAKELFDISNLALALQQGERLQEAVEVFEELLAEMESVELTADAVLFYELNAARAFGEHPDKRDRAIEILERAWPRAEDHSIDRAIAAFSLGEIYERTEELELAKQWYERAVEQTTMAVGPDDARAEDARAKLDAVRARLAEAG